MTAGRSRFVALSSVRRSTSLLAFWERLTNHSGPLGRLTSPELAGLRKLLRSAMQGDTSTGLTGPG